MEKRNKSQKHFQNEANSFDEVVRKTAPFYNDMLSALVSAMPFERKTRAKIVDLGCGTGMVSKMIKERYSFAEVTCVDFSDNMVKIAKKKLAGHKGIDYVICDIMNFDFTGYDTVVSSLALHHMPKQNEKRKLYKKIFKGLNDHGVFYLADLVMGVNDYLKQLNPCKKKKFLSHSYLDEQILEKKRRYDEEDHPFPLVDEINWLKEAGFHNTDVVWLDYHFAVFGGRKA